MKNKADTMITSQLSSKSFGMLFILSMIWSKKTGAWLVPGNAMFFPERILSTTGIIMPKDTPPRPEDTIMQMTASVITQRWGFTNFRKRI
jgi:hypothetical protein